MDYYISVLVLIINYFLLCLCQDTGSSLRLAFRFDEELESNVLLADLNDNVEGLSMTPPLQYRFLLQPSTHHDKLEVTQTGQLYTTTSLDRDGICDKSEMICEVRVDVGIVDSTRRFEVVIVIIELVDVNDNVPTFLEDTLRLAIPENAPVGTSWVLSVAVDDDAGFNGDVHYRLMSGEGKFELRLVYFHIYAYFFPKYRLT